MKLGLKREPKYRPRQPRLATLVTTAVLLPDDREIVVEMKNVSTDGFMAATSEQLAPDTWFGIAIPGRGIVRAQIRWSEDRIFGARFEKALKLQEVELL